MMKNWFWNIGVIVVAVLLGINAPLHADSTPKENSLDDVSMIAVEQTKQLLTNPQTRKSELSQDPKAQQAIRDLKSTGLSEQSQENTFALSSSIFEQMAKQTGGDQDKMNALLNQFQRDPSSIKSFLNEAQLSEIQRLGHEVESPRAAKP